MTSTTALAIIEAPSAAPITVHAPNVSGACNDEQFIAVWLSTKTSVHTRRAYASDAARFVAFLGGRPLATVTVADMQGFVDSLTGAASSKGRTVGSVKALFSFGMRVGYLRFDVGKAVKAPAAKDGLSARILSQEEVHAMLVHAPAGRDGVIIRTLYVAGIRAAELAGLTWNDVHANGDAGAITVFGKGSKTRVVRLSPKAWAELARLRGTAANDAPVFPSRTGRHLDTSAILRVVKRIAKAAGIDRAVSPHWLRHSHASHAIDRGEPVSLVQATLGHASLATTSRYVHARPGDSSGCRLGA
jgi:integrase/recombinase XerD